MADQKGLNVWRETAVVLLGLGATAAAVVLVIWSPWQVAIGLAATAAAAWCVWLERHPEKRRR